MIVYLNGEERTVAAQVTVEGLVADADLRLPQRGVAAAVNGTVVPRSQWGTTVLAPEDRVEVLVAVQGG